MNRPVSDPVCPHCGEPLSQLDGTGDDEEVITESVVQHGSRFGLGQGVGVALIALVALAGAWFLTRSADADPGLDATAGDPNADDRADETGVYDRADETSVDDPSVADSETGVGYDSHLAAERVVSVFSGQVESFMAGHAVAYTSAAGLEILSAEGQARPEVLMGTTFEHVTGYPQLTDGERTWAVDGSDLSSVYLVSAHYVTVDTNVSGAIAFIYPRTDSVEIGVTSYGGWSPGVPIPDGADVLAVRGRGLLVTPDTGGTYFLGGRGRLERISDNRAVAAGLNSEVYRSCDDDLQCVLILVVDSDRPSPDGGVERDGYRLAIDPDILVTVSPDGRFVAGPLGRVGADISDEEAEFFIVEAATGVIHRYGARSPLAVGWAPDSSFLAVATGSELSLIPSPVWGQVVPDPLSVPLAEPPVAPDLLVVALD